MKYVCFLSPGCDRIGIKLDEDSEIVLYVDDGIMYEQQIMRMSDERWTELYKECGWTRIC